MSLRVAEHEARAESAHVDAVEQRRDVTRRGVAPALVETVRNRPQTNVMTTLAFVDAALDFVASSHGHVASSLQKTRRAGARLLGFDLGLCFVVGRTARP